jgi:hypothetical protein
VTQSDGYGNPSVSLMKPEELIQLVGDQDLHGLELKAFAVDPTGEMEPVSLCGPWHVESDPLYIAIKDEHGNTMDSGYGTDH